MRLKNRLSLNLQLGPVWSSFVPESTSRKTLPRKTRIVDFTRKFVLGSEANGVVIGRGTVQMGPNGAADGPIVGRNVDDLDLIHFNLIGLGIIRDVPSQGAKGQSQQ